MSFKCVFEYDYANNFNKLWEYVTLDGTKWCIETKRISGSVGALQITYTSSRKKVYRATIEIYDSQNTRLLKVSELNKSNQIIIDQLSFDFLYNSKGQRRNLKQVWKLSIFPFVEPVEKLEESAPLGVAKPTTTPVAKPTAIKRLEKLSKDMQALLENCTLSNFTLTNGSVEIKAHKSILAARSPYFAKMFDSPFKENEENRMIISDIESEVLKEMLSFIYTGIVTLNNAEIAHALYIASDKYLLEELKSICSEYLKNMNLENALDTLVLADVHNDEELKREGMIFVSNNRKEVKSSKMWTAFIKENQTLAIELLSFMVDSPK